MSPATPEETFTLTYADGWFTLTDGTGKAFGTSPNVKPLERVAWSRGAQVLVHQYDLKRAEP
jgi:hypothetical protein